MSSDQSRVYQVKKLCTDGIHRRESAGIGLVRLKVDGLVGTNYTGSFFVPKPTTVVTVDMCGVEALSHDVGQKSTEVMVYLGTNEYFVYFWRRANM